jgi:7,8-dihydropterin-6-yl-methyl-4-(beta-D-ribofuranosyl)aminobenzene 5'-phosphate synthase
MVCGRARHPRRHGGVLSCGTRWNLVATWQVPLALVEPWEYFCQVRILSLIFALCLFGSQSADASVVSTLKVTVLSTMLADQGIGEWGFAALVEADGRQLLIDTGARPETVLQNARELGIDLSHVPTVVLTHFHQDHIGGLLTLRSEMEKRDPTALSVTHVATGIFYSRPKPDGGEDNQMVALRPKYEATGATFVEHDGVTEIMPGIWLTGPVPRVFPEHNWSGSRKVRTPAGLVEDIVPDDQSVIIETTKGLVVITGCGHAGIVNIISDANAHFRREPVIAIIGGLHLFEATDARVDWTGDKLKQAGVRYLIGAHCTGIEAVYRLRKRMGLHRTAAVVGAVGASFSVTDGIRPGKIAQ